MADRFRATVTFEFEASSIKRATSAAQDAASRGRSELPSGSGPDTRPNYEVARVERASSTERVERVVTVREERREDDG